jgi:colicin import membrane protein
MPRVLLSALQLALTLSFSCCQKRDEDTKEARAGLEKQVAELEAKVKAAEAAPAQNRWQKRPLADEARKEAEAAKAAAEEVKKEAEASKKQLEEARAEVEKLRQEVAAAKSAEEQVKQELAGAKRAIEEARKEGAAAGGDAAAAAKAAREQEGQLREAEIGKQRAEVAQKVKLRDGCLVC